MPTFWVKNYRPIRYRARILTALAREILGARYVIGKIDGLASDASGNNPYVSSMRSVSADLLQPTDKSPRFSWKSASLPPIP